MAEQKSPPVKYVRVALAQKLHLDQYPNFSATGSITGMRKLYGGVCYFIRSGSYIYKVPPDVYYRV